MEEEIQVLKERIEDLFSDYVEMAGGKNYRYHHSIYVSNIAEKLIENLEVNADRKCVLAGALLHDVGRSKDIEDGYLDPIECNEGHGERGVDLVDELAGDLFSDEMIDRLEEIVKNHHSSPETVEGKIVQDADQLDWYGLFDLWRMFHFACQNERSFEESKDYFWEHAVHRFEDQLNEFNFELTKKWAEFRLQRMKNNFRRLCDEIEAEDFSKVL